MQLDFAEIAPVRALAISAVAPHVIAGLRGGSATARPHLELALQMFPQVAAAQNWLRDTAREAGFEVISDRRQWLPDPSGEVGQIVFLDDFERAWQPCFDFVAALMAALVHDHDPDALDILLHGLVSCGIIVNHELKIELETAVARLVPQSAG